MVRLVATGLLLSAWLLSPCPVSGHGLGKEKRPSFLLKKERLCRLTPLERRRYDHFFLESVVRREAGDDASAYLLLQRALQLNPTAPEALYELSRLLSRLPGDNAGRSLSLCLRAASLAPEDYNYLQALAEAYLSNALPERAVEVYEYMARAFPSRVETLYTLASFYSSSGDYASLIPVLSNIEEREGRSEALSLEKMKALQKAGRGDEAEIELRRLMDENPGDLHFQVMLGDLFSTRGEEKKALQTWREVLSRDGDNPFARLSLLGHYSRAGEDSLYLPLADSVIRDARVDASLRESILADLVSPGRLFREGDTLRLRGIFQSFLQDAETPLPLLQRQAAYLVLHGEPTSRLVPLLQRILSLEPENSAARRTLLSQAIQGEDNEGVLSLAIQGCQYEPGELAYYYFAAAACCRLGREQEAIPLLREAMRHVQPGQQSDLVSDMYLLMGDLYHEGKRQDSTYVCYDLALSYNPDNVGCLNNYAYFLSLDGKDLDRAAVMGLRAVESEPDNITYLDTYAWVLFTQGRYAEAKAQVEHMLPLVPSEPESAALLEHAGDILSLSGETKRAVSLWRRALSLDASLPLLKKKIQQRKYIAP